MQRSDELGCQAVDVRTQVYQRTRRIAVPLLASAVQRRGALERVEGGGRGGGERRTGQRANQLKMSKHQNGG